MSSQEHKTELQSQHKEYSLGNVKDNKPAENPNNRTKNPTRTRKHQTSIIGPFPLRSTPDCPRHE